MLLKYYLINVIYYNDNDKMNKAIVAEGGRVFKISFIKCHLNEIIANCNININVSRFVVLKEWRKDGEFPLENDAFGGTFD